MKFFERNRQDKTRRNSNYVESKLARLQSKRASLGQIIGRVAV